VKVKGHALTAHADVSTPLYSEMHLSITIYIAFLHHDIISNHHKYALLERSNH